MSSFGFAGAAAGATDALTQLLARKRAEMLAEQERQQQQANQARSQEVQDRQFGLQERQFAHNQQQDVAAQARQTQQDDIAATGRRQVGNQQGVRRMIGDFLVQRGSQPLDAGARQTLQGMAVQEDVDLPASVTEDPAAGLRDYEARRQIDAKYQQPSSTSQAQDWVIRDGQPTPIQRGTAQPGDTPYDPVAARSSQPENNAEAADTASEVRRIAGALRQHSGLPGVFGVVSSRIPTMRQSTADAETLFNSLKGLLTLENMGKMKGVLSDSDMRVLQQASTTLDSRMSEPAARAELDRLVTVMDKVVAGIGGSGVMVNMRSPDGTVKPVPGEQVEFYRSRGATVVGQ